MQKEPVLIILAGLAVFVGLGLEMTNLLGWTTLTQPQTAAVVGFVAGGCALVGAAIRGAVVSPATHAAAVQQTKASVMHVVNVMDGKAIARAAEDVLRQRGRE